MKKIILISILSLVLSTSSSGLTLIDEPSQNETYEFSVNGTSTFYNLKISIPHTTFVKVIITDSNGNIVRLLLNENIKFGSYQTGFDIKELQPGKYKIVFQAKDYSQSSVFSVPESNLNTSYNNEID